MKSFFYSVNTDIDWQEQSFEDCAVISDFSKIQVLRALAYKLNVDTEVSIKFFLQRKSINEFQIKDAIPALLISGADVRKLRRIPEGNTVYHSNTLAAAFDISKFIAADFEKEAKAVCPKCGKTLSAWMFPNAEKGVLCLALKPTSEMLKLTAKDLIEMFELEYLIVDGFLKRADECDPESNLDNIYAVVAEESFPLSAEKEARLIDVASRYEADGIIECYHFLSRRVVGEKLSDVSANPYCSDCGVKLEKQPNLSSSSANLLGWQLYDAWLSDFSAFTVEDLFNKTSNLSLRKILDALIKFGFADYLLNAEIPIFSAAERLRMSFASLTLSELHNTLIVFDEVLSVFSEAEGVHYFDCLKEALSENCCVFLDEEFNSKKAKALGKITYEEILNKLKKESSIVQLCGSSKRLSSVITKLKNEANVFFVDIADCPNILGNVIFEKIATEFSESLAARLAGLHKNDFLLSGKHVCNISGYNSDGSVCSAYGGKRAVLEVTLRGLNIAQVLDLSVNEALSVFSDSKGLSDKLALLQTLGFGDYKLSAPILTVKEKERLALFKLLSKRSLEGDLLLDDIFAGLSLSQQKDALLALKQIALSKNFSVVLCSNRIAPSVVELYCVDE